MIASMVEAAGATTPAGAGSGTANKPETAVLGLMSIVFVPFFFFASVYAQVSLRKSSSNAGEYILFFFVGFVIAAQVGGRILDKRGAKLAVVSGCAIGAVGFYLLAHKLTDLSLEVGRLPGARG
jgi:hypothetical protein